MHRNKTCRSLKEEKNSNQKKQAEELGLVSEPHASGHDGEIKEANNL